MTPADRKQREAKALGIVEAMVQDARKGGADAADVIYGESTSVSASWRMGQPEDVERSESCDLGLRVIIGKGQACVSTTDLSKEALTELVRRAVSMARLAPEDKYCGLADADELASNVPDPDAFDAGPEPETNALIAMAREAEESALAVKGVTNSEGGGASYSCGIAAIAASNGFADAFSGTSFSVSASVIAGEGSGMERDYDYHSARHRTDLDSAALIGRKAGEKAVRRLHPRKVASGSYPVVYDPRVSGGLIGHLSGAINGQSIARGTSFLKDQMGKHIFAPGIRVIDDPLRKRGLRSRRYDSEGLAPRIMPLVDDGILQTWVLDCATARQLGLKSTGHAMRGYGSPPSPQTTNLYLENGKASVGELIADIKSGFYVTELMGFGISYITGDYSRGASGFWIENGEIAYPVAELTVAGNLKDMFKAMTPANDLSFRYATNAPTVRIDGMTVAGS